MMVLDTEPECVGEDVVGFGKVGDEVGTRVAVVVGSGVGKPVAGRGFKVSTGGGVGAGVVTVITGA